jgi:catechol-2,3-dioxygenase
MPEGDGVAMGIELCWDRPREDRPPPTNEGDKVEMYTRPLDIEALLAEAVGS